MMPDQLLMTTSKDLEELFDLDFTENEEYYRPDTLSLGYKNEAQRVIAENTREDGTYDYYNIIRAIFNSSCYDSYEYGLIDCYDADGNPMQVIAIGYTIS